MTARSHRATAPLIAYAFSPNIIFISAKSREWLIFSGQMRGDALIHFAQFEFILALVCEDFCGALQLLIYEPSSVLLSLWIACVDGSEAQVLWGEMCAEQLRLLPPKRREFIVIAARAHLGVANEVNHRETGLPNKIRGGCPPLIQSHFN